MFSTKLRYSLATAALAALLLSCGAASVCAQSPLIIPEPQDLSWKAGNGFTVNSSTQIVMNTSPDSKDTYTANQLRRKVWDMTGQLLTIVQGGGGAPTNNVIAIGDPARNTAVAAIIATWPDATGKTARTEGSMMGVKETSIVIQGYDQAGTFYGCQTLIQLLEYYKTAAIAPLFCYDYPDLPMRGTMVRIWNDYDPVVTLEVISEIMARSKLNYLQLDLEAGLGVIFPSHPELYYGLPAEQRRPNPTTFDMVVPAVNVARQNFMEIIGAGGAYWSHSDGGCTNWTLNANLRENRSAPDPDTNLETLCGRNPSAQALVHDMWNDLINYFNPPYIHPGWDEVSYLAHSSCPYCAGENTRDLFTEFLTNDRNWLNARGKQMVMWADMLRPDMNGMEFGTYDCVNYMPTDILLEDWEYLEDLDNAASLDRWNMHGIPSVGSPYGNYDPWKVNIYNWANLCQVYNNRGLIAFNKYRCGTKPGLIGNTEVGNMLYYGEWAWSVNTPGLGSVYNAASLVRGKISPDKPTSFTSSMQGSNVYLTWTNPPDTTFQGTWICYKTDAYPTEPIDSTFVADVTGNPSAAKNYTHTTAPAGKPVYYAAFSHDSTRRFSPAATSLIYTPCGTSRTLVSKPRVAAITVDGASSDWNMAEFVTPIRGGQAGAGDYAVVGYDAGTVYYGGTNTGFVLPTSSADHLAKVYSRQDATYLYFLVRCDDSDMRYSDPTSANWANDCIEFYIDPGHDHGTTAINNSTSDLQLDIDANNQKNVYMTTSGYATQVLAGVTSAVVRNGSGWTLEVRITKTAIDPDIPAGGSIGIDFGFRDNDNNNDLAQSSFYAWADPCTGTGYMTKIPQYWSDITMSGDSTPPGPVNSFTATPSTGQVALTWTNPSDADFTGTLIRFKTTGYPTSTADGTLVADDPGTPGAADGITHSGLTAGVTYYYSAWSHDAVPNYTTTKRDASATVPTSSISTLNVKSAANLNLVIDASSSDWVMGDFTTNSLGGQNTTGDIAVVGFSGGVCYYGGYNTSFVLPTNAADHTGKIYSRHDQQYQYFLVRCDDAQMVYANPTSANWANDCIEFYIDPSHNHGASPISNSTSDLQLVIDCNNQKNVYMTTTGYASQVLAGVTSAVVRDGTGWWLEAKILKSAIDPDLPASGSFGVDFMFRDNDNYDGDPMYGELAYSTFYGWRDNGTGVDYCAKIPDSWGNASLATLAADTTPPASVTGFSATAGSLQLSLAWTNPQTADWTGTMVRYKTGSYPTGPTDGTQVYNGTGASYVHTGLTGGVTYYYCAYAYDEVPNYATAAQVTGVPTGGGPIVISNSTFNSSADGWTITTWKSHPTLYQPGTMVWQSSGGNPSGCMKSTGSGSTEGDSRCTREGGAINKTISTAGRSGIKVYYDLKANALGQNFTGYGSGTCAVDHDLIDEQITVFYSTNGGTNWIDAGYVTRATLLSTYQSFGTRMLDLTGVSACNNNANFAVRLRWQFNTASDTGWLDNVRVEANN